MGLEIIGAQPHSLRAKKAHGPNVGLFQLIFPDYGALGGVEGFFIKGHIHPQNMR